MKPVSLGDDVQEYAVVSESHPLPTGRRNLVTTIEALLARGGVQKLTVELGKPIRVRRSVPKTEKVDLPDDLIDDDIYAAARNSEMLVLDLPDGAHPLWALWEGFNLVSTKNLKPRAILVSTKKDLSDWLGRDVSTSRELFGAELIPNKNIPNDALLLVASDQLDSENIVLSIRIALDSRRKP